MPSLFCRAVSRLRPERWGLLILLLAAGCAVKTTPPTVVAPEAFWNSTNDWVLSAQAGSAGELASTPDGLRLDYRLGGEHGFVQLAHAFATPPDKGLPLTFLFRADGPGTLEIKAVDADGSIFWIRTPLTNDLADWRRVTVYPDDLVYGWNGDAKMDELRSMELVISGQGEGRAWFRDAGPGRPGLESSVFATPADRERKKRAEPDLCLIPHAGPRLDPDRDLPGIGFKQRRADRLISEDPLVLEWLKQLQDTGSPERNVLRTGPDSNELQTFNNALAAMAFLLKGEKERAERILDFYAAATDRENDDPTLQSFFYKGEARGFFQLVEFSATATTPARHHSGSGDRWMGDMSWLLIACKYHEKLHGPGRYRDLTRLLKGLLISWYADAADVPGGGYVRHGWRKGDRRLHEEKGHPEGNIDAYAAFRLCGEDALAGKIRVWLEAVTGGNSQPLDVYAWRVQAYGGERCELLDIPDGDLRYRKTVEVNGQRATGFYGSANGDVENIWLDGLGQMACAYAACGNLERSWFYANQYDPFLQDVEIGGVRTRSLPYTANEQGGFDFDQSKGFVSPVAWYIFCKNGFNPMTLERAGE